MIVAGVAVERVVTARAIDDRAAALGIDHDRGCR
jgi:hypothetical protein